MMTPEQAFVQFQTSLATVPLEECASAGRIYSRVTAMINGEFEPRYGLDEVSPRIAEHATDGGDMSDDIGTFNELSEFLINNCGYTERSLREVHGTINQNIVDSIALYSSVPLKKIPIFTGELTSYASLATQKIGVSLHGFYNGFLNKLGVVTHEVPNYVSNKLASVTGGDDATLVLGLGVAGTIGLGIFVGKRINNLD
jgi:hypothetical protein